MSINFGEIQGSAWRGPLPHIAMAIAGAFAFSMLVSGVAMREGSLPGEGRGGSPAIARAAGASRTPPAYHVVPHTPTSTIYIVSSEAQAHELQMELAAVAIENGTNPLWEIYVVDTPERLEGLAYLYAELGMIEDSPVRVIDKRPQSRMP